MYMGYDPNTHEQILELKDGRTIFKTHNGFKSFVKNKKGIVLPITDEYYKQVKHNRI